MKTVAQLFEEAARLQPSDLADLTLDQFLRVLDLIRTAEKFQRVHRGEEPPDLVIGGGQEPS